MRVVVVVFFFSFLWCWKICAEEIGPSVAWTAGASRFSRTRKRLFRKGTVLPQRHVITAKEQETEVVVVVLHIDGEKGEGIIDLERHQQWGGLVFLAASYSSFAHVLFY